MMERRGFVEGEMLCLRGPADDHEQIVVGRGVAEWDELFLQRLVVDGRGALEWEALFLRQRVLDQKKTLDNWGRV